MDLETVGARAAVAESACTILVGDNKETHSTRPDS